MAPDCIKCLIGKIGDYQSDGVNVTGGSYYYLRIGPPSGQFSGRTIEFYYSAQKLSQTDTFASGAVKTSYALGN